MISTHAPLARCDDNKLVIYYNTEGGISTHAPLARCDQYIWTNSLLLRHFYSRTSCEVRRRIVECIHSCIGFLLTHLLRGATAQIFACLYSKNGFLLTHLLRGATYRFIPLRLRPVVHFYSRTSCEVRHAGSCADENSLYFYSRTSCEVRRY